MDTAAKIFGIIRVKGVAVKRVNKWHVALNPINPPSIVSIAIDTFMMTDVWLSITQKVFARAGFVVNFAVKSIRLPTTLTNAIPADVVHAERTWI